MILTASTAPNRGRREAPSELQRLSHQGISVINTAEIPAGLIQTEQNVLTPYVTGLVFANCVTAAWLVVTLGALHIASNRKFFGETLTHQESTPTRLPGSAEPSSRPLDITDLSKEDIHELPTAA